MAVVRISARGAYIHPGPVVRIGRTLERAVCGTHGYDRLVFGGPAIGPAFIAGSEYHDSAGHRADLLAVLVHTGVRDEVIYGCLHRSDSARRGIRSRLILVAPAVLGDDGTVVGCPYHCRGGIAALILFCLRIILEYLAGKQLHASAAVQAARNAADTLSVAVDCAYRSGDVGPVVVGDYGVTVIYEVLASVAAARYADCRKVLVAEVDTAVDNGHNHVGTASGVIVPYGQHINIAAGSIRGRQTSVIIVMPLLVEERIVRHFCRAVDFTWLLHIDHTVNHAEIAGGLCGWDTLVIIKDIPLMEAPRPVSFLPFFVIRIESFRRNDIHSAEHILPVFQTLRRLFGKLDNHSARYHGVSAFLLGSTLCTR